MKRTLLFATVFATVWLVSAAFGETGNELFQKALVKERSEGNLKEAIKLFQQVVDKYGKDRALAAKALVAIGESQEKLGEAEARKTYERIVREYADQKEAVVTAQTRLGTTERPNAGAVSRRLWTLPERGDLFGPVSADGRYAAYVGWKQYGDLFVHDLITGADRQVTNTGTDGKPGAAIDEFAEEYAFSRDGRQLAYSWFREDHDRYELRVVDLKGTGIPQFRRLLDTEDVDWISPDDWSPDGKSIAVQLHRKDNSTQIGLVSVGDGALRVLKSVDWRGSSRMSFSADGKYLAFDSPADETMEQRDVFVLAVDGSREIPAVVYPAQDALLGWSPDGTRLLFASDRDGSMGLWALTFSAGQPMGEPELVKRDIGRFESLGIAGSGALYFWPAQGLVSNVQFASLDFSNGRLLSAPKPAVTSFVGANSLPDWSPDGRYLAYASRRRSVGSRYFVIGIRTLATGAVRELVPSPAFDLFNSLQWAPDGLSFIVRGRAKRNVGLFRVDAQTGRGSLLAEGAIQPSTRLSPSGDKLYFARSGKESVLIEKNLSTGSERELIRRTKLNNINLSPDGRFIAVGVVSSPDSNNAAEILLVPTDGGEPRGLMRADGAQAIAVESWMPDSRSLLLVKLPAGPFGGQAESWRTPIEGQPVRIELDPNFFVRVSRGPLRINPDGKQIAYELRSPGGPQELWVLENFLPAVKTSR